MIIILTENVGYQFRHAGQSKVKIFGICTSTPKAHLKVHNHVIIVEGFVNNIYV